VGKRFRAGRESKSWFRLPGQGDGLGLSEGEEDGPPSGSLSDVPDGPGVPSAVAPQLEFTERPANELERGVTSPAPEMSDPVVETDERDTAPEMAGDTEAAEGGGPARRPSGGQTSPPAGDPDRIARDASMAERKAARDLERRAPARQLGDGRWWVEHPVVVGAPIPVFESIPTAALHRVGPYRPDTVIDAWGESHYAIRAASLRGYGHRHDGRPRQDDMSVTMIGEGRMVVAVTDGVSSADQSHLGATVAARWVTQAAENHYRETTGTRIDWAEVVRSAAWAMVEQASSALGTERTAEAAERVVASTLVAADITFDATGAEAEIVGVGDSGAWVLSPEGFESAVGGKDSEAAVVSHSVSGLPRLPSELSPTRCLIKPGHVLLLGTDGFGDPLGTGNGEVGRLFSDSLLGRIPAPLEFAHLLDFSRETFDDDRTLVAVWPLEQE